MEILTTDHHHKKPPADIWLLAGEAYLEIAERWGDPLHLHGTHDDGQRDNAQLDTRQAFHSSSPHFGSMVAPAAVDSGHPIQLHRPAASEAAAVPPASIVD